jgi:membrane-associated phospholipid phosphatase
MRWPLLYVPAAVAFARLRRRVGPPPPASTVAVVYAAPVAVAVGLPRGRVRDCAVWIAHMWAYKVAFETPYDHPHRLRRRLRIKEPIAIDRRIGRGVPPGQRLQRRLRRPPELTWLDKGLTALYLMWELEPHIALAWLLYRHPARFGRAAVQLGVTFDLTLIGYFATPTAPPWWASEKAGEMDGDVRRVTAEVLRSLRGESRPGSPDDHSTGSNPWAAWPSDHFASSLAAALALMRADGRAGALGLAYATCLGFTLVYSGEHYVVDVLLGAALALAVDRATRHVIG